MKNKSSLRLKLKNIGLFEEAEVLIDGITLIAGENDTGKSTIGKVIFSLIKADNMAVYRFKNWRINKIKDILKDIGNIIYVKYNDNISYNKLRNIEKEIYSQFSFKYPKYIEKNIYEKIKSILSSYHNEEQIQNKLKELGRWINSEEAFTERRRLEFQSQVRFNFGERVQSINSKYAEIEFGNIYEVNIRNNRIIHFRDNLPKNSQGRRERPFKDATLIESPIILNLTDFFNSVDKLGSEIRAEINYPYMMKDVVKKLFTGKHNVYFDEKIDYLMDKIKTLISSEFTISQGQIILKRKENGTEFPMISIATGLKSFGVIYLLLKNSYIKDFSTFLIIDEPEVHLHPEWQVKYAELLVKINKNLGCLILINTHSPYFVQAIKYFSNKYKISDNTHFYLAIKKSSDKSKLELVDENITKIFDSLIQPLEEIPF